MMYWAKLASWHILRETPPDTFTVDTLAKTLCGRWAHLYDVLEKPRPDEKTCERCFQLQEGKTL